MANPVKTHSLFHSARLEEGAEQMWDEMMDSLADDGYKTVLLARQPAWSYSTDEE